MEIEFNNWLYKAIEEYCKGKRKEPHDVFPYINLTDAKLSFIEGMSSEEYLKTYWP